MTLRHSPEIVGSKPQGAMLPGPTGTEEFWYDLDFLNTGDGNNAVFRWYLQHG